jgi:hypothetical protein
MGLLPAILGLEFSLVFISLGKPPKHIIVCLHSKTLTQRTQEVYKSHSHWAVFTLCFRKCGWGFRV